MYRRVSEDRGFTLVELMVVVLIIGVLVSVAIPIFNAARAKARRNTCYGNQRMIEGTATTWASLAGGRRLAELAGVVNRAHPVVVEHILRTPPTCPSGSVPADPDNPTVAEGAYVFNATGWVQACPHHGHY
jgi:prepilin-type N-terminal cleavage/methylation domain-containing protein